MRVPIASFGSLALAPTFTRLIYPNAAANEVLAHDGFITGLNALDSAAADASVTLRPNQSFRVQGIAPRGAVGRPAIRSQHLIGRAVGGNIVDGNTVNTSAMLLSGTQTRAATAFIAAVKKAGLRWGGDFGDRDPPHFDSPITSISEDYDMTFYFCRHSFANQHPVRGA